MTNYVCGILVSHGTKQVSAVCDSGDGDKRLQGLQEEKRKERKGSRSEKSGAKQENDKENFEEKGEVDLPREPQ